MTVRCPKCDTRYRLPPRSRLGRNPTYRCTRCRYVFAPDEEAEAPALEEPEEEIGDLADEEDDQPVFTVEPSRPDPDDGDDEETGDELDDTTLSPRRRRSPPAPTPPASGTGPTRDAVLAAVIVMLTYGILSIYLHTHPAEAHTLFAKIPLIGDEITETRLHPGSIQLADVHGDFRRVHGDRLVFVITGTAINNAPVPIASVQVQGQIIGPQEQRQIVYCGAAPQDVTELGIREIELLQTLKPSSDWLLRPGEQDRFLVAFIDPPQPITDLVVQVVAVRGTNGRNDGPSAKLR